MRGLVRALPLHRPRPYRGLDDRRWLFWTGRLSKIQLELFNGINQECTSRGLAAVTVAVDLVCAAEMHSSDIGARGACTYTGADGSSPGDRVNTCNGNGWRGEIVACGQGTPAQAIVACLNSSGHRAIMLDPAQREIGVAMYNNYWTAIF